MSGIAGESVLAAEHTAHCHSVKSAYQPQNSYARRRTQHRSRSRRRAGPGRGAHCCAPALKAGVARYASCGAVKRPLSRYASEPAHRPLHLQSDHQHRHPASGDHGMRRSAWPAVPPVAPGLGSSDANGRHSMAQAGARVWASVRPGISTRCLRPAAWRHPGTSPTYSLRAG
jgi:hypothetical protein